MTRFFAMITAFLIAAPALASDLVERPGWTIHKTSMTYNELIGKMKPAIWVAFRC